MDAGTYQTFYYLVGARKCGLAYFPFRGNMTTPIRDFPMSSLNKNEKHINYITIIIHTKPTLPNPSSFQVSTIVQSKMQLFRTCLVSNTHTCSDVVFGETKTVS